MYFIINPKSGNGRTKKRWEKIIRPLIESKNIEYNFKFTEYPNHATEIVRDLIKKGNKFIVAVGGDGTFNEVINGFFENDKLVDPNCVFGLISSGTGSDTIKTLGHSKDFEESIEILQKGSIKKIDIGIAKFRSFEGDIKSRYFLNIADIGLGGDVVDRVNRTTKIFGGKISFYIGSIRGILHHKMVKTTLIFEDTGEKYECNLNLAIFANGKYFGGGMKVAPDAINDDGLLDIITAQDMGRWKLLKNISKMYSGKHLELPEVKAHPRCKKIKAESEKPIFLDLDGEQVGTTDIEINIYHKILPLKTLPIK
ncbi:MAG: diacylglycerol/lipid kinase family protein [Candidatus Helarchaeota archaeon]